MLAQARLPLMRPRNSLAAEVAPDSRSRPALPPLTIAQRDHLRTLPKHIVAGLRILRDEWPPMLTRADVWAEIATDAIMIAADGWARRSFDNGWSEHDVFGCAAARKGDDDLLGLAGYLRGRTIHGVSPTAVVVADQATQSTIYRRQSQGLRVFLWEYGR